MKNAISPLLRMAVPASATIMSVCLSAMLLLSCEAEPVGGVEARERKEYRTYCNPIDIDYTYSVVNTQNGVSYRSGADPAVVRFGREFYMFVTRSQGYWHSTDLCSWEFIRPARWYFESSNAPGAWERGPELLLLGNPAGWMSLIKATDPHTGNWEAVPAIIPLEVNDPALFVDDDNRVYLYKGSSNVYPIVGVELDPGNYYLPVGEPVDLIFLDSARHGWERFGEDHVSEIGPFLEGAWMTKYDGRYYLQYAAPGTQWNVYADGVYVGDHPLGPFEYASYNPVAYKPGGFITGAGHGSTVEDNEGRFWHFGTMRVSVNYNFERRIGMFPAGFTEDGEMYVNTAYGDYPHYLPCVKVQDHRDRFTGWMLLSYRKPVRASSVKQDLKIRILDSSTGGWMLPPVPEDYSAGNVTDENIRTCWVAETNGPEEWLEIDLEQEDTVYAVQVNYQDVNSSVYGKPDTLYHRFLIEYSANGKEWKTAADMSGSRRDQPNAYIEFTRPFTARFIRFRNIHVPNNTLAVSGFRVFGRGGGACPEPPRIAGVSRGSDSREVRLAWHSSPGAFGYTVYWGIDSTRLNNNMMIYGDTTCNLRALNSGQDYFYAVEAFNATGISGRTSVH